MTLWTVAHQAPLSMGFPRHEYWSGLPCPPPGDLLDPEIEPTSLTSTCIYRWVFYPCASLVAQRVKNLPAMQETGVQSLGREESLERGMTAHSGFLAWRIPRTEEPGGLQSTGSQRVRHDLATKRTRIFIVFPFSKVKARVRTISSPLG